MTNSATAHGDTFLGGSPLRDQLRRQARILVVDDREPNLVLLRELLSQAGYENIDTTADPRDVQGIVTHREPDIILLDLHMPQMDGYQVMERLEGVLPATTYLPILVLTADVSPDALRRAFSLGARDFLPKPFDAQEVLLRIRNLLETRLLHVELKNQNAILEHKVRERTHDLEEAQLECLERLALAAEFRDDETGQHTQRVGRTASLVGEAMGLPGWCVEMIRRAAPLHDIGKIGVRDEILLKPGKLTPEEFDRVKEHTAIGGQILSGSHSALLQLAEEIAITHHERWDGNGYTGVRGDDIPLIGRIVAIADVYDALVHDRPYKDAWTEEDARAEIESQSGGQFDPRIVEAFLEVEAGTNLTTPPPQVLTLTDS